MTHPLRVLMLMFLVIFYSAPCLNTTLPKLHQHPLYDASFQNTQQL